MGTWLINFFEICSYSADYTGPVNSIAWTPDNSAFAVGWKSRGLAVWSVSGCRLMSTVRQIGLSSASSPKINPNQDSRYEPLMNGTSAIQWDEYGYRLFATEEASCDRILAFSFGKCCLNRGVSGKTYIRQVMYGEDRLLMVQAEDTDDLKLLHLKLPVEYKHSHYPFFFFSMSRLELNLLYILFSWSRFLILLRIGLFNTWQLARMGNTWLLLVYMV